ncbi:MAG: 50S ribosomal protein L21 [Coriobacteriia bacterium]|nr:50S ribosomal protein L21 [Coriobacteriia bacterium]
MYAVVSTGGKQLKVEKGMEAVVEKLDAAVGETVSFTVLFVADDDSIVTAADALASASVTAEVVEHFKGDKAVVFKFKKRKGYKRLKGHRQLQTRVVITDVSLSGGTKAAAKVEPKADKAKPKKAAKPESKADAKAEPKQAKPEPKAAKAVVAEVAEGAAQCAAIKSDGDQCANKPKEGSKYCGVHAKKFDGQ